MYKEIFILLMIEKMPILREAIKKTYVFNHIYNNATRS